MNAIIPHRQEVVAAQEEEARLFLREFNPKKYSTFYARIYDADAYLEQVGLEMICELIEHGNSIFNIAKQLDISTRTLRSWIGRNAYRKQQVHEAYTYSGDAYTYKAEETLLAARGPLTSKQEVAIAGKLADHYRWMASKRDKEQYGESKAQDTSTGRAPLVLNMNFGGEAAPQEKLVEQAKPLVASFLRLHDE